MIRIYYEISINPFTTEAAKSSQPEMTYFSWSGQKQPQEKGAKKCAVCPR